MTAALFGPDELEACRDEMIRLGWCRTSCNVNTYRIRRAFKWATRKRLVPASVFAELTIVEGLAPFRSPAPERELVKPVADSIVDACLPHMPRVVAEMVQLRHLPALVSAYARDVIEGGMKVRSLIMRFLTKFYPRTNGAISSDT